MKSIKVVLLASMFGVLAVQANAMDAEAGKKVFKKCKACHVVEDMKNKVGPSLKNVMGRQPGVVEGFKYSKAMIAYGEGKVWDDANMDEFLLKPKKLIKGTKMSFAGLKKEDQRQNVIAYIKTFSEEVAKTE